ncbi:glycosyltransferase family 4 protein [Tellurirhabdus rosea]|uniref:glycosyltransferase family 4 protein n=1 Tax=Tellurirhabdus rosea TaxID=2674997 RepID=UPI00224DAC8F|nr:glycosyltransferase family 1 protein [Tellurirhabdus rosea]
MNILYYIPELSQAGGGARQYSCALLRILAQDKENKYFILHNDKDPLIHDILNENPHLTLIPRQFGRERSYERLITNLIKGINLLLKVYGQKRRLFVWGFEERLRKRYQLDIIHCPYQHAAHTKAQVIATLHDVQELHFPEFFTPEERLERAKHYLGVTERANVIVVSYQHVKEDLIRFFRRTSQNVYVCLLDMQQLWFEQFINKPDLEAPPAYAQGEYILYPAATWPHKNHLSLLAALAHLRDHYQVQIKLIATGHQTPHFEKVKQRLDELQLHNQVIFTGIVPDVTLYNLYQRARAVVVPTRYEAGSFPLMESLLMGIPVICSNVTSLPETIGDPQFVFDPDDVPDMADKILRIMQDGHFRQQSLENARKQGGRLKNTDALWRLQQLYQTLSSKAVTNSELV